MVKDIVDYFNSYKHLDIKYKCEFDPNDDKNYEFLMFGKVTDICYFFIGAFAYIFLENAYNHGDRTKQMELLIRKSKGDLLSFNMVLSNHKKPNSQPRSSVTIDAFTRLFNIVRSGKMELPPEINVDDGETDKGMFSIEITNIIKEDKDK